MDELQLSSVGPLTNMLIMYMMFVFQHNLLVHENQMQYSKKFS